MNTYKSDFRIAITPRRLGDLGAIRIPDYGTPEYIGEQYMERCQEMIGQIRRHTDDVDDCIIEFTNRCIFCDSIYELDEDGVPVCCNPAINANKDKGELV